MQSSQADKALELLAPHLDANQSDVGLLQVYGEVLLETNDLDNGYQVLAKACQLDPQAVQGSDKFFYLGQIVGGYDGLQYIDAGWDRLRAQLDAVEANNADDPMLVELAKVHGTKELLSGHLVKKLNQGLFAKIEIWMTDLCMEEKAEFECDRLIQTSLELDGANPEAYSLLGSIRISQQRPQDAKEAVQKAWLLFLNKKRRLEEAANQAEEAHGDAFEVGLEYVELIQPLLTLARYTIELEEYDLAVSIASNVQDINEDILEAYYYEALAYLFRARQAHAQEASLTEDYRDVDLGAVKKSSNSQIAGFLAEAKTALTQGYRIINSEAVDADPELIDQVNELLGQLGGPNMAELMPSRRNDEEEEGWENEIHSDDE